MVPIAKKELLHFFSGVTGWLTIALFLSICGIFLFILPDSSIFNGGYATLDGFFSLAPWVLMFLIPAVCMRTFSDEYKGGTFEVLRTMPLMARQIALGKYIAVLTIVVFAIVPTLLYPVTVRSLSNTGSIEGGAMAGSYIGLFALAAVFAAICLCCSSFTSNSVVAFLLGALACLALYYGFHAISLLPAVKGNADYFLEMLGIDFHYKSISRGVIDSRDMIYFLTMAFFFLYIATQNISKH